MHQKKKMKKRIIAITMILALCLALFACGSKQSWRDALESQVTQDVRAYLNVLCSQSDELSKVGIIDVTYMAEDTNSPITFTPSEDATPEEKKKMDEMTVKRYNVSGNCSALDKYNKEYTGTFDGTYVLFEVDGNFLVQKESLTVN